MQWCDMLLLTRNNLHYLRRFSRNSNELIGDGGSINYIGTVCCCSRVKKCVSWKVKECGSTRALGTPLREAVPAETGQDHDVDVLHVCAALEVGAGLSRAVLVKRLHIQLHYPCNKLNSPCRHIFSGGGCAQLTKSNRSFHNPTVNLLFQINVICTILEYICEYEIKFGKHITSCSNRHQVKPWVSHQLSKSKGLRLCLGVDHWKQKAPKTGDNCGDIE